MPRFSDVTSKLLRFLRSHARVLNKKLIIGFALLIPMIVIGLSASLLTPYSPTHAGQFSKNLLPSLKHPLGTDQLGIDVFSEVVYGLQASLLVGTIAGLIGILMGTVVGAIAGYKGGLVDGVLVRVVDAMLVFPVWPMMVIIAAYLPSVTILAIALIIGIFNWAWPARSIRSQVMSLKERDFVHLAKLSGLGDLETVFKEVVPNMLSYIGANLAYAVSGAIVAEAALSLIGLGPMDVTTLGKMLFWARMWSAMVKGLWWWILPPALLLVLIFMSLQIINIGLDETYNPRLKE
jgi:peptide/nickel transport system permease protein